MAISREHGKWKKDHTRWTTDTRKWKSVKKKVAKALRGLQQAVNRHNSETKAFLKKAKSSKSLMSNGKHSTALHKKLRKTHTQQNQCHALQSKARKDLLRVSQFIEKTLRDIH